MLSIGRQNSRPLESPKMMPCCRSCKTIMLTKCLLQRDWSQNSSQQSWNRERTQWLGTDPKEARAKLRAGLQPGFYISNSGKRNIRTLHQLGLCYMLPGVDYTRYTYAGSALPSTSDFDNVCKWCAKSPGFNDTEHNSSATDTASSSEPGE